MAYSRRRRGRVGKSKRSRRSKGKSINRYTISRGGIRL